MAKERKIDAQEQAIRDGIVDLQRGGAGEGFLVWVIADTLNEFEASCKSHGSKPKWTWQDFRRAVLDSEQAAPPTSRYARKSVARDSDQLTIADGFKDAARKRRHYVCEHIPPSRGKDFRLNLVADVVARKLGDPSDYELELCKECGDALEAKAIR